MKSIVILGSVVAVLVLSAMPGVAYLSTTAVYAVGGKEKNKKHLKRVKKQQKTSQLLLTEL